jgi:hypothetical protein
MGLADFDYAPSFDPERKVRVFEGVFESLSAAGKLSGDMPDFAAALMPDVHAQAHEMVGAMN